MQENNNDYDGRRKVPTLISNLAVLEILRKRAERRSVAATTTTRNSHKAHRHRHRDWVETKTMEYISITATTQLKTTQNAQKLQKELQKFALTEAETLQVVNALPTEPVEIHLIVEDLHERMTARKQEELLATVRSFIESGEKDDSHDEKHATMSNGDAQMKDEGDANGDVQMDGTEDDSKHAAS